MDYRTDKKVAFHLHSECSLLDGAMTVRELTDRGKELGLSAMALTDHGTCIGWYQFLKLTKEAGILGVPGVELYVINSHEIRSHLVVMAKNTEGYRELCRAVTESNRHIVKTKGGFSFPTLDYKQLEAFFGHGNVIATSACIAGPAGTILLYNDRIRKKAEKQKESYKKKFSSVTKEQMKVYSQTVENIEHLQAEIRTLTEEKKSCEEQASKKYLRRKKALNAQPEGAEKEEALRKLRTEEQITKAAKKKQENLKNMIRDKKTLLAAQNEKEKMLSEMAGKALKSLQQVQETEAMLKDENVLFEEALSEIRKLHTIFGDDFYLEIQNHGMDEEKMVYQKIIKIASIMNIPLVASNDAHIAKKEQWPKREMLQSIRFGNYRAASAYEQEMYVKDTPDLYDAIKEIAGAEMASEALNNTVSMLEKCEEIDIFKDEAAGKNLHYPKYLDEYGNVTDSMAVLKEKIEKGIEKYYPDGTFDEEHRKRLYETELPTIQKMGVADYLLIVQDFLNYARTTDEYGVGPGRGSGVGSEANQLLGITSLDPSEYSLLFERFLNIERITMPDIDSDFSEKARASAIAYVQKKYGEDHVAMIHTKTKMTARSIIRNVGNIVGCKYYGTPKPLYGLCDRMAKSIPQKPGVCFDKKDEEGITIYERLLSRFQEEDHAEEILKLSKMCENSLKNLGIHAAGVVISDGAPLSEYVPLVWNEKKQCFAVQTDMVETEEIGLLKMDFLGLKNLDVISLCKARIRRNYGKELDLDHLPQEPDVYREIMAKGNTANVFQLESSGMREFMKQLQPECLEDVIAGISLYRPGPMSFIPKFIEGKRNRHSIRYDCPELKEILEPTYGCIVYQEQISATRFALR